MELSKMPLISVVVPVYGTEKYLKKCFDSILGQTYKNIELIVVNDGSKDNSEKIIKEYLRLYDNIKYVRHSENRGLFQARISGAEEAAGDYIAFVDSDDYISCDFYRLMLKRAIDCDADMVMMDFCLEQEESGIKEYYNHDPLRLQNLDLKGEEVLQTFMEQRGTFYSWQVIWNKLISRKLWLKCAEEYLFFSKEYGHLIMTEDIAFTCALWIKAQHVVNVHNAVYFYVQNKGQSIKNDKSYAKYLKNQKDVIAVFDFFKNRLLDAGKYEIYKEDYIEWKRLYGRIYYGIFCDLPEKYPVEKFNYEAFDLTQISWPSYNDNFFYSLKTKMTEEFDWFEDCKHSIISQKYKIVSFDIFDTLVMRPYFQPVDLFSSLNGLFDKLFKMSSFIRFSDIRVLAEQNVRKIKSVNNPEYSEVTLNEIYDYIESRYQFNKDKLEQIKELEIKKEIECSSIRETGKELYDLALDFGKEIIFTSDMYLPEDVVTQILKANGYDKGKVFLSSTLKITKANGQLYNYILKDLQVESEKIVHIGDNWNSDIDGAQRKKMKAHYLPSSKAVFKNDLPSIYGGEIFKQCFSGYTLMHDMNNSVNNYVALRNMFGVVANKFFDQPYSNFNKESDFNADPKYIGYYAVGFYIFSIAHWLLKNAKKDGVRKLHFVARDGYLVKQAYDILAAMDLEAPESNYLYVSRTTTAMLDIEEPIDLYSLYYKMSAWHATPNVVLNIIGEAISARREEVLKEIPGDIAFNSREQFDSFISYLIKNYEGNMNFQEYRAKARSYFSTVIGEKEAIFDIGYNGRVEQALTKLLGFPVNSYYIHKNSDFLNDRALKAGFCSTSFYNYKPMVTGVLREHIMMKLCGTTIGYDFENMRPILDKFECDYSAKLMTEMVQRYAVLFVKDLVKNYGSEILDWSFEYEDATLPMEYYLHNSKKVDRSIFSTLVFEDVMGEGKKFRAIDFWNKDISKYQENVSEKTVRKEYVIDEKRIGVDDVPVIKVKELKSFQNSINKKENPKAAVFLDLIEKQDAQDVKFSKCAGNTGNLIDWDSIIKLLDPPIIKNWFMTNPGGFDDNDFDTFITTSLIWVEENSNLTYLDKALNRLGKDKILLPLGVGFSCKSGTEKFSLSKESIHSLAAVAERCHSVGVRGEHSAEILNGFGIKNLRIIGTPSLYTDIIIFKTIKNDAKEIGKVSAGFKPFYGHFSQKEKELLSYFESNQFDFVDTTALKMSKDNFDNLSDYLRLKEYEAQKNIYFDLKQWKKSFEDTQFTLGMNFHHNVVGMHAGGIPALFITYESIGKELCQFHGLPSIDIEDFDGSKNVMEYYRMADYSSFIEKLDTNYNSFITFLNENGIYDTRIQSRIVEK